MWHMLSGNEGGEKCSVDMHSDQPAKHCLPCLSQLLEELKCPICYRWTFRFLPRQTSTLLIFL